MILPAKHLRQDRALLGVGAEILSHLDQARTVSELWESVRAARVTMHAAPPLSFDWFVLSLSFLYGIRAIDFAHGIVSVRIET
jgi:hypothetical protein